MDQKSKRSKSIKTGNVNRGYNSPACWQSLNHPSCNREDDVWQSRFIEWPSSFLSRPRVMFHVFPCSCFTLTKASILLRQLMRVSSWDQLFSVLGKKYGRLGLLVNALSSCGLLPMNDAGLLIALSAVPYLILKAVLCVIRHQSRLTISLWAAPLQGNSGFISFHKLACEPSPPSFLIHHSLIGGKGPVMI